MPQIALPADYCLRRVKHDYPDFRRALAREFIQNSVDAGATRIDVMFQPQADGSCFVVVQDDGRGCSRAIIESKLLVFGGSGKDGADGADGAVGGFGLAKELLYLAWPRWQIETRGVLVTGEACDYQIAAGGQLGPEDRGFRSTILIPASESPRRGLFERAFVDFVADCRLRGPDGAGVVVTFDGEELRQRDPLPGRALRDLGWCKLYREPNVHSGYIQIRARGVAMFEQWSGHDSTLGRFTVELTGRSIELLTAGRNAFKSSEHRRELSDFIATLRTDSRKAVQEKAPEDVIVFCDDGAEVPAEALDGVVLPREGAGTGLGMPGPAIIGGGSGSGGSAQTTRVTIGGFSQAVQLAQLTRGSSAPNAAGKPKVQVPDYGVPRFALHTRGQLGKVQRFLDSPKARPFAQGWYMAVQMVLAAVGMTPDAVGFTFVEDAEGECLKTDTRTALFVNPTKIPRSFTSEELLDIAIHEVAHLRADTGHTEPWAIEEMQIRRALRPHYKAARAAVEAALRGEVAA